MQDLVRCVRMRRRGCDRLAEFLREALTRRAETESLDRTAADKDIVSVSQGGPEGGTGRRSDDPSAP